VKLMVSLKTPAPRAIRATAATACVYALAGVVLCAGGTATRAQEIPDTAMAAPARPKIAFNRWQEDWSVLADPALRTEPLDSLKYIPLSNSNPLSYLSFGLDFRERFETNDAQAFYAGPPAPDSYVIQRFDIHADLRIDSHWQVFTQLQDDRVFGKTSLTPVDADKLDLEQAFALYSTEIGGGTFRARVGRQEFAFDLQRFISTRDGPNVRQAFDAVWTEWDKSSWEFIAFWTHPVQTRDVSVFDDTSSSHLSFSGLRVQRKGVGPGSLSAYLSRYESDNTRFLFATGNERRDILDIRYVGKSAGFDWDVESMGQKGTVSSKTIHAWAVGSLGGYTWSTLRWQPRVGLQIDAASGTRHPDSNTLGTFNPLFSNGYYFAQAGYTGYTNLIHVKPSITISPIAQLTLLGAVALQWRETTDDAVYRIPNVPVAGTAGEGSAWSGVYGQIRADYAFNRHLTGALEAVHFAVGDAIKRVGGRSSDYVGLELKYGW
jgi:hypothetical protein